MSAFNVQNLPKSPVFGFDLRKCIKAPPGKKFIIADLAQIEARVTRWLAGDMEMLALVAAGMNIYEAHAQQTMGWEGAPGTLKIEDPNKYALAKARELSLGFGCGPVRFRDQAKLVFKIGLDWPDEKFKAEVKDYRAKNPKIERTWNQLEMDFKSCLGGNYEIELPSGRLLTYFDVSTGIRTKAAVEGTPAKSRQSFRARVEMGGPFKWWYGAAFLENCAQGTARDVFGDGLLRVEDHRPDLVYVWPTHDEAVWIADESDDTAVRDVEDLLSVTPDWLPGCPIAAEVKESICYEK